MKIWANTRSNKVTDPNDTTNNIADLRDGTILTDPWVIVYKPHINRQLQNKVFYLNEKHRYSTYNLNTIIAKMEMNTRNKTANKKHITNTVKWWIMVRMILTNEIEHVYTWRLFTNLAQRGRLLKQILCSGIANVPNAN